MANSIRIENNKLVGEWTFTAQFLHGSPDVGTYPVTVIMTGAEINSVVKKALDSGTIIKRKSVKTKAQAEALAKKITWAQFIGETPADPDSIAAGLPVDQLSAEATAELIARLQAKLKK